MRTVRHSLQRHGSKISRAVFCVTAGVEEAAFAEAATVYFPRPHEEDTGEQVDGRGVFIGLRVAEAALQGGGGGRGRRAPGRVEAGSSQVWLERIKK